MYNRATSTPPSILYSFIAFSILLFSPQFEFEDALKARATDFLSAEDTASDSESTE